MKGDPKNFLASTSMTPAANAVTGTDTLAVLGVLILRIAELEQRLEVLHRLVTAERNCRDSLSKLFDAIAEKVHADVLSIATGHNEIAETIETIARHVGMNVKPAEETPADPQPANRSRRAKMPSSSP